MDGICKSIITKSGLDSTAFCTASRPSTASAQTLQRFEWDSRRSLRTCRMDEESSAINIRADIGAEKFGISQASLRGKTCVMFDILHGISWQENTLFTV